MAKKFALFFGKDSQRNIRNDKSISVESDGSIFLKDSVREPHKMIRQSIHLCFLVIAMILITYYTNENENVKGQEQQPTNITANLETMIKQNERIIKQNDETAIQNRADTFIATTALLISLSLVIYGFQISRQEKITQKAKRHYQIIILSLVFPVFILIGVAWFAIDDSLYPHYNIMASLLLIPALIVTVLMFSSWIG